MDGVIVAYHNTKQIFGFQYISLDEMDTRLSGGGQETGDRIFKACVRMLENVAEEVAGCFPKQVGRFNCFLIGSGHDELYTGCEGDF